MDFFEVPQKKIDKIFKSLEERYQNIGKDPWGLNLRKARKYIDYLYPFYKNYFQVRTFGLENLPDAPVMMVANHGGQIALDGMLVSMATVLESEPPRLVRGMIERWMAKLPFIAKFASQGGSILGDRKNCLYLLEKGESILVFPEGVEGVAKSHKNYYKMQNFTHGFYRMALHHRTAIVPVAVIGAEETYPFVRQMKGLANFFKLPSFPLSPLFLLGPLGFIPLPSPIDIYFGRPIIPSEDLNPDSPDELIQGEVKKIQDQIKTMLKVGLEKRRPFLEKIGLEDIRELHE